MTTSTSARACATPSCSWSRCAAGGRSSSATCGRLVQDNLNTHTIGSLYEAFAPEEARRLARRLEIHPTPVHGSWLNMAETELSILERQCLDRRLEAAAAVRAEVGA